jgi:hypothetical protein
LTIHILFKMAEQNGSVTLKESVDPTQAPVESKGKGKAAAEPETRDVNMEGDDSSSEEELDEVCHKAAFGCQS